MKRISILIIDDSARASQALSVALSAEPDLEIVGLASDGEQGVELAVQLRPDVVLMDFDMPETDGLRATGQIMERAPARILLLTALDDAQELDLAYAAVTAGALELVAKHRGPESFQAWSRRLGATVRIMFEVPVVARRRTAAALPPIVPSHRAAVAAMGVVASAGGPQLIAQIVANLPADLPAPVLVIQHLPSAFSSSFIRWLAGVSRLPVELATDGGACVPGHVYLGPGDAEFELHRPGVFRVRAALGPSFTSGDCLLASLAAAHGAAAGGLVLTGMGHDGAAGLLAIRRAGGLTAAQDEATSAVYGMPREAHRLGGAMHTLSAGQLASFIASACRRPDASRGLES